MKSNPSPNSQLSQQGQVLLCSEDAMLPFLLAKSCQEQHLQLSPFQTPEALLAARIQITQPRLIIIDAGNSFDDAFALYRQLRQTSAFSLTPVLFLVSVSQIQKALDTCNLQNNDYLVQPFNKIDLDQKLHSLLKYPEKSEAKKELETGDLVGRRYEIIRFLGAGGMGQVYHVRDLQDPQEYAFKLLLHEGEEAPTTSQNYKRFQKEIEALRTLQHPNIVKLYNYGQHETFSYYTMDYLPHGCLADVIEKQGTLPYPKAVQMLIPLCSALHHAHQRDFLHRDLKPANILFKKGNIPILTDFGLALHIETVQTRLTKQGNIIGTVHYMSPEQIVKPHDLDGRCDLYALGVMFFEMLTGQTPFQGAQPFDILRNVLSQPTPDVRSLIPSLPEAVADFCQKAIARDRDKRFASGTEMAQAAAQLLTISPSAKNP